MRIVMIIIGLSLMSICGASEFKIDMGGPLDEMFIKGNWGGVEGPYDVYGPIWRSACRWAYNGATVTLPLVPGVDNTVEIRGEMRGRPEDQKMLVYFDNKLVTSLPLNLDLHYKFSIPAEMVGEKTLGELRLETAYADPVGSDSRDLRIAVDWIMVSADGPSRNFVAELMASQGIHRTDITFETAPRSWRMQYDPNNVGNTYAPHQYSAINYDDSAWEIVPTKHTMKLRRGDVMWYRAWLAPGSKLERVQKDLRLPGDNIAKAGCRDVWVNGVMVKPSDEETIHLAAGKMLNEGLNLIVVKAMQGPFSQVTGDDLIEPPIYHGSWTPEQVSFRLEPLILKNDNPSTTLRIALIAPDGHELNSAVFPVNTEEDKRVVYANNWWPLKEFGENRLVIEDADKKQQSFPVYYLGLHLFHWGWYSGGGATAWDGFKPCSNNFIDQLFERVNDWRRPYHSISWGGAIIQPGLGFHGTQGKDYIAGFREQFASGSLDFVGMPFAPRNICTDFGESLLRSMRYSQDLYGSQFDLKPKRFYSHDATMTPQLAQVMQLCGYDTYTISENWWGQGQSVPNSRDCYMQAPDGSRVRVLDSWYHGLSPITAAHRAVEQGKPAVLCNEEFACLDATQFLEKSQLDVLSAEGIFLQPVSLAEYQQITDAFASEVTYTGDGALCYKGWTGGGPREFEFEKANRLLETRLVAYENLTAWARHLGIEVDQAQIYKWWVDSLRHHECHLHWGNAWDEAVVGLQKAVAEVDLAMQELAVQVAERSAKTGVVVINPLGFERSGLLRFPRLENCRSLKDAAGNVIAVQRDPDDAQKMIASAFALPSVGLRSFMPSPERLRAVGVKAEYGDSGLMLENEIIRLRLASDGAVTLEDNRTSKRRELLTKCAKIYLARPSDAQVQGHLSLAKNPLNLDFYTPLMPQGAARIICSGPVMAVVEIDLACDDYPALLATLRISLVAGEQQARMRLKMNFTQPTVIIPPGMPGPHEGVYVPGVFIAFPMAADEKPLADLAYCFTDDVLSSTNHETFLKIPFRNGTFNTLSLAGPASGKFSVLTQGLPDFFVMRKSDSYIGMSLGVAPAGCEYSGVYTHDFALFAPTAKSAQARNIQSYLAAQSFYVEPLTLVQRVSESSETETSFISASGEGIYIPGVQYENGIIKCRVVNLGEQAVTAKIHSKIPLQTAQILPRGDLENGKLALAAQAIRELVVKP